MTMSSSGRAHGRQSPHARHAAASGHYRDMLGDSRGHRSAGSRAALIIFELPVLKKMPALRPGQYVALCMAFHLTNFWLTKWAVLHQRARADTARFFLDAMSFTHRARRASTSCAPWRDERSRRKHDDSHIVCLAQQAGRTQIPATSSLKMLFSLKSKKFIILDDYNIFLDDALLGAPEEARA